MSYFGTIYADTELPSRARAVYMYLRDRSDAEGKCCHGQASAGRSGAARIPKEVTPVPSQREQHLKLLCSLLKSKMAV